MDLVIHPGSQVGNFSDRLWGSSGDRRQRQLNDELLDDQLAEAKRNGRLSNAADLKKAGALSIDDRKRVRRSTGEEFPGYTGFAKLAEDSTQQLHLVATPERTRAPYGRVSETSHGTLLGLLSDSEPTEDGRRRFRSDDRDHEAVAARAGQWWITAITMCSAYFGWDWAPAFGPFDEVQRALFEPGEK